MRERTARRKLLRKLTPEARKESLAYGAERQAETDKVAHEMMLDAPNAMVCRVLRDMTVSGSAARVLAAAEGKDPKAEYRRHQNRAKRLRKARSV